MEMEAEVRVVCPHGMPVMVRTTSSQERPGAHCPSQPQRGQPAHTLILDFSLPDLGKE